MPVKTYFVSGFLGAGKTTLLNNLLKELADKRVGVIMNEFGQVNIDAKFIEYSQGMEISEINNGSIFCTCLSGSFVKKIVELSKLPLDYLLVESSGMARPASIGTILDQVNKLQDGVIDYRGMITLVDTSTYLNLVDSVNAVREQVAYSDLVIINKTDLVDESLIVEIEKNIFTLNPGVKIIKTRYAKVDNIFEHNYHLDYYKDRQPLIECDMDKGMLKNLLEIKNEVSRQEFFKFLNEILADTYRIKGVIKLEDDLVHVDCVANQLKIDRIQDNLDVEDSRLVFISDKKDIKEIIESKWAENISSDNNVILS